MTLPEINRSFTRSFTNCGEGKTLPTHQENEELWLDIGCGTNKMLGAVGIDRIKAPGVDIVHDLNAFPWPVADNSFDHIVCSHSLSHLNDILKVVEEIYRISKDNAVVEILAPHYASDNFNTDPTHKIAFGIRSMDYFLENHDLNSRYQYSPVHFSLIERKISFRENETDFRRETKINPFRMIGLEKLVNHYPRIFERFFVYWLPPSEVYFKLRVHKKI